MASKTKDEFERRRTIAQLRRLLAGHGGLVALLFVVMLLAALAESFGLSLVLPLISSLLGASAESGGVSRYSAQLLALFPAGAQIEGLLMLLAGAFLAKGALLVLTRGYSAFVALKLREDWAGRIFNHYLTARYAYLAKQRQGTLVHNVAVEPYRAARAVTIGLDFVNRVILTLVLGGVLLAANWQATLVVALVGALLFYAVRRATYRYSYHFGRLRQQLYQEISALVAETVGAVLQVKLFALYGRSAAELGQRLSRHTRIETAFRTLSEIPPQSTEFLVILFLAAGMIGLRRFFGVEPQEFVALLGFFVIVSQRLLTNLNFIIARRMKMASYLPSLLLMDDLLQAAPERETLDEGEAVESLVGDIEFTDVHFAHQDGRRVFTELALAIPAGKTTAIVGASGVGKSTLADLLLSLHLPQQGHITIGGRAHRELSLESLRQRIGYVSQDPAIFNASVLDNIRIGRLDASEAEIIEAARIAHADEFVSGLPAGYDTVVGDRGVALSGGQRQRLAIARVILRRPDLYIFDEATSALDGHSEGLIRDAIAALSNQATGTAGATVIVIAHRLSTIEGADLIYELDQGRARRVALDEVAQHPAPQSAPARSAGA
ncbi:MAG: ABC transporter ATP-binding protein [Alphaproteobacteria bacterium]|nr:ABC transporter ATP-binding protein [Alphaproteobacteria bacterium]